MTATASLITGFNPSGTHFFVKSTENKLTLTNVFTNKSTQLFLTKHSISRITLSDEFEGRILIAIATENSEVVVYDISNEKPILDKKFDCGKVLSLSFGRNGEGLWIAGQDQNVLLHDLWISGKDRNVPLHDSRSKGVILSFQLETKGNPNNIGLVPLKKEQLLIHAGKKAFLYDYTLQKRIRTFHSHSNPIQLLSKSPNSKLFLTFSNEALLNVFSLNQEAPLLQLKLLSQLLISLGVIKINKTQHLLFVQYPDTLQFWLVSIQSKQLFVLPQIHQSIRVAVGAAVLASNLTKKKELMLAIGDYFNPKFKHLSSLMTPENRIDLDFLNKSLDIQVSSQKILSQAKTTPHINEQATHVIGQSDYIPQKSFSKVREVGGRKEFAVLLEKHAKIERIRGVDSLSMHLLQSLQTNDFEMINFCLSNKDVTTILNTIRSFEVSRLSVLLEAIIARIESFPQQSQNLLVWLKTILEVHSEYLMAMPGFGEKVGMLGMMMGRNTGNLEHLQRIQSKVELIVSLSELDLKRKLGVKTYFRKEIREGLGSKGNRKKEDSERKQKSTISLEVDLVENEKNGFYGRKKVKFEEPLMVHEEGEKVEEEVLPEKELEIEEKGFDDSILGSEGEQEKDFDDAMKIAVKKKRGCGGRRGEGSGG